MNIHGLDVSSSIVSETFYDWSVHFNHVAKKEKAQFDLAIACFV